MRFEHAAVTGDEASQRVRVCVVHLEHAFRRPRGLHFIPGDEHAHPGLLDGSHMVQAQGRHQPQVLRTQAPADIEGGRSGLKVFATMADVLARRDGSRHNDLPGFFRGVLGRNDRVDAVRHRGAGHDPHGRAGRKFARERLAGHGLAQHAEVERVVLGGAGCFRSAQRKAVHRGSIEARDVERRNHSGCQRATAGVLEGNRLRAQPRRVPIDPVQHGRHFAALPEAVHAHVEDRGDFGFHTALMEVGVVPSCMASRPPGHRDRNTGRLAARGASGEQRRARIVAQLIPRPREGQAWVGGPRLATGARASTSRYPRKGTAMTCVPGSTGQRSGRRAALRLSCRRRSPPARRAR